VPGVLKCSSSVVTGRAAQEFVFPVGNFRQRTAWNVCFESSKESSIAFFTSYLARPVR